MSATEVKCERCDGNGWIWFKVPAFQASDIYKDKKYLIDMAKRCPACTKAKESDWDRDFDEAEKRGYK